MGMHVYFFPRFAETLVLHDAIDERIQCVVASSADIQAGMDLGTPLANDDGPGSNNLPGVPLHTKPLRITVPTILRTSNTLLVCHSSISSPEVFNYADIFLIFSRVYP